MHALGIRMGQMEQYAQQLRAVKKEYKAKQFHRAQDAVVDMKLQMENARCAMAQHTVLMG